MKANRTNGFLVSLEKILDDLFRSHNFTHIKLMQIREGRLILKSWLPDKALYEKACQKT
jgi:hypothetical protein